MTIIGDKNVLFFQKLDFTFHIFEKKFQLFSPQSMATELTDNKKVCIISNAYLLFMSW